MRSSPVFRLWSLLQTITTCTAAVLLSRATPAAVNGDLCTISSHRAALLGSRYYFQGGFYTFQGGDTNAAEKQLYWLDLNTSFPVQGLISTNTLHSTQATSDNQFKGSGAFLTNANQTALSIFGGQGIGPNTMDSMPTYNLSTNIWSNPEVSGGNLNFIRRDGMTSTSSDQTGQGLNYVLGGLENYHTVAKGLVKFDASDPSHPTWTNQSNTDVPGFNQAGLEYIRAGKAGLLIAWGGFNTVNWGPDDKQWPWNYRPMDNIAVYDIDTSTWYNVTATGDIPQTRAQFCSAVSAAPDDSSFQIHMYGGTHLSGNVTYQDLYILTIPSFRWIKKTNAGDQGGAKGAQTATAVNYYGMQCAMYKDRQMIILGGFFDDPVTKWNNKVCNSSYPVVKVLDVTNLQWVSQFDPSLDPYSVPHTVFDVIGGDTHGGATLTTPQGGFNDSALTDIFSKRVARYTAPASALPPPSTISNTPNSPNSPIISSSPSSNSTSTPTGAIAGGVVGGVAAIAAVAGFAFWFLRSRRKRRSSVRPPAEKSTTEDVDKKETLETPTYNNSVMQEMEAGTHPATQEMPADSFYEPHKPRELDTGVAPVAELPSQQFRSPIAK
ncbi:MAG: hypothetical protein M1812_002073 [Candelaria pacifica]|nr:MAG: hypothetical protein M1812_002073 [Candelaria pacifica]